MFILFISLTYINIDVLIKKAPNLSGLVVLFMIVIHAKLTQAPVQELPKVKKITVSDNHY